MATPAPVRVVEWNLMVFRHHWRTAALSSVVQPLLFLLGMGVGVGLLVDANTEGQQALDGTTYLAFLGPALLATTAMLVGSVESMWPVLDGFKWRRMYVAMTATPIAGRDLVVGHLLFVTLRCLMACGAVAVVLALFDDTRSWGLIPAVGFAAWCGLAFAMPIAAWAATCDRDTGFPGLQRFVITPMFLFSGAFYPIEQLPEVLQVVARVTPLWHGVELCRGSVLGTLDAAAAAGHVAYLGAWIAVGTAAALRTYPRRLAA